ncbi:MAG: SprB repeat-containing protein, partial [Phaeodactylibacter sp.]|nr:SprB repeat-containing protein [Phaeodactylibacter sp.]
DLDADDQTGAEFPNIYLDTTCLPVVAYGNYSILLESEIGYIDSIQIHLAGIMDIGFEVLSFPQTTGIGIQNNNSPSITLYNEGAATPNDFAQLLSLLLYENAQPNYSFGTRTVGMTAFANIYQSETAYAYLTLSNAALILNAVISPPSCFASSDGSIELNPLGGTTPYQYQWNTGADAGVLLNLEAGAYSCTLSDDQGCWKSEDFYLTAPDSLIVELLGPSNNQVCGAIGTLVPLVTGGMPAYQFEWLSGQQDSVLSGLGAGNYQLTVSDQNGCQAFADLDLVADTILLEVSENRCVGDTYFYQGIPLTVDTSFCISAQTIQGCDSSYCLNLQFIDTSLTFIEQSICQGESVVFDGTAYSEDTYLQISYSNILGCDSTVIFDLEVLENQTNLDLSICAGESYYFNGTALEEAGLYYDTLTAFNGCDSLLQLDLSI